MCCFAGDTKIKLANGELKAIKDIKKGDEIKGVKGKNKVTKIHKPWLHFRRKYSINDGEYFTTAEHPFMTKFGWRAIKPYRKWYDPECWANWFHEHKDLEQIKPLKVGDKIITEKGQIEIYSIKSSWNPLKWFERVYNISLDNDNTYYADGFLVHNKGGNPIAKIFKPVVNIFKKVVKAVTNIFSGFLGAFGMSFDAPDMGGGADYEDRASGIKVNKQSNVEGIPVVYGRRLIGGVRVWAGTSGSDHKHLYVCLAVAEGEINGFKKIYIDDEDQTGITSFPVNPTDGTTVKTVSGSKYYVNNEAKAEFQFFTGGEDQKASELLKEHSDWTDSHRLRGVAYVACKFTWVKADFDKDGNQTRFNPWRGLPEILVEVEGKKVLSGDYSSHGTTNTNTYGSDLSSMTYSDNPADCLMDYLRNPRYGKGLNDNRIDFEAFRSAQQVCDTQVTFKVGDPAEDLFDCNTFVKPEDNMFQNTKKLLQTCRGFLPYTNGKYQLKIETAESTPGNLIEITDDMLIGDITVVSPDKNSKYNEAHITFSNKLKDFESDTAIHKDSTFLAEDGNEPLILKSGAPGITNKERAEHYAEYLVNRSRKQLQLQVKCTSEAQQLVAGDLCTLTHSFNTKDASTSNDRFGYMFKAPTSASYTFPEYIWRVTAQKLNYDGTVDLTLMEHQNDIYDVTQRQEDTDLSARDRHTPPGKNPPPNFTVDPPDFIQPGTKYFTITTGIGTVFGKKQPKLEIDNNNFHLRDFKAVRVIYKITLGNNILNNPVDLPHSGGSGFTNINGTPLPFGGTVKINISSQYANGDTNAIESHTVTLPPNPSATASGGI